MSYHWYYEPFNEFEHFFDDSFSPRLWRPLAGRSTSDTGPVHFKPRMDVIEDSEGANVTATFELPGVKREEVNIDINQDRLTISGEASPAAPPEERKYKVHERSLGKYSRTLMLPQGTKPGDVQAKMENGLLTVTFPKAQPHQAPQRITVA